MRPRLIARSRVPALLISFAAAAALQGCQHWKIQLLPTVFHRSPMESVPAAPPGAEVRQYAVGELPFCPPNHRVDVKKHLKAAGIKFPEGGFAYFFPKSKALVVATTPAQHDKIGPGLQRLASNNFCR